MPERAVRHLMGMPWTVDVRDETVPEGVIDAVYEDLEFVDRTFSTYRPDSEVERLNRGELRLDEVSPAVREVLDLCDSYFRITGGHFSSRASGRLDPSGLVKGWAIRRACRILEDAGCASFVVDGAGDAFVRGGARDGEPWRIGIRHPIQRDKVARVVEGTDLAIATSGTYEKGRHLVEPLTGTPAESLLSMTVVGPDMVAADVFATAAFVMGPSGLDFVERQPGYEAYAIDHDLVGRWTSSFPAAASLTPAAAPAG